MAVSPSSSSDDQFALGSVLDGRYRIDAVLGTGGMGRVYRAEHTKIGKSVAIKVLHADLGRNREASQRFQREAIASGRLDHPNIVGVSDFGVLDDGACYLVMEVLEGESLGDRLTRDHRIHWVEAIDVLRGVLNGLRHAHERGVVHRDIKPDNIYLARKDGDPIIKILDFGIAKLYAGTDEDPASTRAGLTVGTPAYLSPEQAVGGEITPKSDLYSASIVLYEMLAGRAPFEDKDPLAMLGAHVSRTPPAFAQAAPGVDIPPALEDIVQHGLRKLAADRIASAADYLALLDAFSPPLHALPRYATSPALAVAPRGGPTTGAPIVALRASGHATTPLVTTPVPVAQPGSGATPVPVGQRGSGAVSAPIAQRGSGAVSAPIAQPASGAVAGSLELPRLERARRAVSLADVPEPIPQSWIVRSGVFVGAAVVVAIALAIVSHCNGAARPLGSGSVIGSGSGAGSAAVPRPAPSGSAAAPPAVTAVRPGPTPAPPAAEAPPPPAPVKPIDPRLAALIHDLETSRTCAARKAVIPKLVELRNPAAVPALRRARTRMTGGLLGIGQDNANACLRLDAERAIKALGGTLK